MITRRIFLKQISFYIAGLSYLPNLVIADDKADNQSKRFEWRVPKANFETVKKELKFDGEIKKGQKDEKGLPLVFIFVGLVLIPYLAKAILALRRDIVYGGVVIDTRHDSIHIDTDKSLSSGVIVVVTPEGTKMYERDEIENPTELVNVLLKATK